MTHPLSDTPDIVTFDLPDKNDNGGRPDGWPPYIPTDNVYDVEIQWGHHAGIDVISIILTIIVAGISMIVGVVVSSPMEAALPSTFTNTTLTHEVTNVSVMNPIPALIMAGCIVIAVMIIGCVAGLLERY